MDSENTGIRLLNKGKKGLLRMVFSRAGLITLLLLIQIVWLLSFVIKFNAYLTHAMGLSTIFTVFMILCLINGKIDPSAKITWLVIIMVAPLFGALLLWYTQSEWGHRMLKKRIRNVMDITSGYLSQDCEAFEKLKNESIDTASLSNYISQSGCYPVYDNTDVLYLPTGEDKFEELLKQLKNAQKFIFLEYFIIDEGIMWGKILNILIKKASEGVEVRVIYDGSCEFTTLPSDYPKKLQKLGIKCKVFSPLTPFVSTYYNYRDHRKIFIIDGVTAFTGGVNLADEYINEIEKYGHWKDAAVMLKGEAVKSFMLMFLQMWAIDEKDYDFEKYLNVKAPKINKKGYVIPYADCPLDNYKTGELVYMDILNRSNKYVHIMTPYLILDSELETAIKFAAERGIDVKIILPGIPDKKIPYAIAKTHYESLIESGIKIYEYTPGFVHSKVFVCDDIKSVVGTINLDYRSLYHHFECAAYMYNTDCIKDIEEDFQNTLVKCRRITKESMKAQNKLLIFIGKLLKVFSPLL